MEDAECGGDDVDGYNCDADNALSNIGLTLVDSQTLLVYMTAVSYTLQLEALRFSIYGGLEVEKST